jgi:protoporphyrinogen oxidase
MNAIAHCLPPVAGRARIRALGVVSFLAVGLMRSGVADFLPKSAEGFGGESCQACHQLKAPPGASRQAEDGFDVVIVGGGMAGLSTLHYLADRKVVLLEAEPEAGGQMRQDEWRGIRFAKGAAYFVEPYGFLTEFYRSAGIPLRKIHEPENSAWIDGKFYPNCWTAGRAQMPWPAKALPKWVKFLEELEELTNTNQATQPVEYFSDGVMKLDAISAEEYMQRKGLTRDMIDHINRYVPSCFGVTAERISAAGFINYLGGELAGNFTLEGGLGAATELLFRKHQNRVRLSSTVVRVEQDEQGVTVSYLDAGRNLRAVRAKTAVMAVPARYLPTLVQNLPEEKKQVIGRIGYAAYLVAAVLCRERFWDDKGYDTWVQGTVFNDIIDADWIARNGRPHPNRESPHVLSLYLPFGGGKKIYDLLQADPAQWKERIIADLDRMVPGARGKIEDVRLYRWGHSMHVAEPGFLTKSVPVLRKPFFRIFFAGAEIEGLPCNESAIISGFKAAQGVHTWLWDRR